MARLGRPPKPTRLKILNGNPGRRPLNLSEPKPKAGAPKCPTWLSDVAKEEWRRVVKILLPLGLVTHADMAMLAGYCQAVAELRAATEEIVRDGRNFTNVKTGVVHAHPAVAQQRSALAAVQSFAAAFGLDPSSRSKLKAPEATESDPFEVFLRGGKQRNV